MIALCIALKIIVPIWGSGHINAKNGKVVQLDYNVMLETYILRFSDSS
jgi:hypothetical protein